MATNGLIEMNSYVKEIKNKSQMSGKTIFLLVFLMKAVGILLPSLVPQTKGYCWRTFWQDLKW